MVICLERGADLYTAQLMSLPLTVSCFSKILIGVAFLVPAHPGSPGKRAVKRVCVVVRDYPGKPVPERLFVAAKFYCPHAPADGNQRIRSREKTMEFSAVLPTLSPYQVITALERNKQTCASTAQCRVHISVTIYFSTDYNNIYQHLMPKSKIQTFHKWMQQYRQDRMHTRYSPMHNAPDTPLRQVPLPLGNLCPHGVPCDHPSPPISISSSVFAQLTLVTDRQTDRPRYIGSNKLCCRPTLS